MADRSKQAFPNSSYYCGDNGGAVAQHGLRGMTLREYYAGLAMQGMLANPDLSGNSKGAIVNDSITYADALLAALGKKQGNG